MVNTVTAAELKRRGMAAIEAGLQYGPVHIFKHNRPTAVVLSEQQYQEMVSKNSTSVPGMTALDWLLNHDSKGKLTKRQIDQRLQDDRDW